MGRGKMARLAGFEPATPAFGGQYSIQLSYKRVTTSLSAWRFGEARGRESAFGFPEAGERGRQGYPQIGAAAILARRQRITGSFFVDHKQHDRVFFVNFGKVVLLLHVIGAICFGVALAIDKAQDRPDEQALARLQQRIEPIGTVVTDPNVLMQMAAANKPARAPYSGEEVLTKVCAACHDAGVLDAPKTTDKAAWNARIAAAGGLDQVINNAISGKGLMPPKGGDMDLSDDEVKAAVQVMLKKSGL